jgi:hypothetical protein
MKYLWIHNTDLYFRKHGLLRASKVQYILKAVPESYVRKKDPDTGLDTNLGLDLNSAPDPTAELQKVWQVINMLWWFSKELTDFELFSLASEKKDPDAPI